MTKEDIIYVVNVVAKASRSAGVNGEYITGILVQQSATASAGHPIVAIETKRLETASESEPRIIVNII